MGPVYPRTPLPYQCWAWRDPRLFQSLLAGAAPSAGPYHFAAPVSARARFGKHLDPRESSLILGGSSHASRDLGAIYAHPHVFSLPASQVGGPFGRALWRCFDCRQEAKAIADGLKGIALDLLIELREAGRPNGDVIGGSDRPPQCGSVESIWRSRTVR